MRNITLLTVAALGIALAAVSFSALGANSQPVADLPGMINLDNCLVQLNEVDGEALVPAQEAGVMTQIKVRDGQEVRYQELLASIDDAQARKQKENAMSSYKAADEDANSDIDIQAAKKAADVTELDYKKDLEASRKTPGTISIVELTQKKFQWDKMILAIEQANKKKTIDGYTSAAKKAEMELAQIAIDRREIRAPIDGVVEAVKQHLGEWVKPGDPVFRLMRLDRLSVEGFLKASAYNPADVANRNVTVVANLAGGRTLKLPGKIVFVANELQGDGRYTVRAEVDNQKENGQWLLRPGMSVNMAIQLK